MPPSRLIWRTLTAIALVSFLVAAWDLAFGGFRIDIAGLRISSWELYRPVFIGVGFMALAFYVHDRSSSAAAATWDASSRTIGLVAMMVPAAFVALAISYGSFVAGGADGYGYVSQSDLWISRRVIEPYPLASLAPQIGPAVTPIGYRLARTGARIVPSYAPGLPLTMALGSVAGGPSGAFLVVPLLGGLAVFLTYRCGARAADARTGLVAAVLLAVSPLFLFHSLVPMSDVPDTAWWLLAWLLATGAGDMSAAGAGLATAAALMTRPNLVPVALALGATVFFQSGLRRAAIFAACAAPSCLAIAGWQQVLYGSPFESGHGAVSPFFRPSHLVTNVTNYLRSLLQLHTPLILAALAAPVWARPARAWPMLAFCGAVFACYAFYTPYEHWTFLRFLLPALPFLLILLASVLMRGIGLLPLPTRGAAVATVCLLAAYWSLVKSAELGVFAMQRSEQRYAVVGASAARVLPPSAAVLSVNHSGSLRRYGSRQTLRWDLVEPDRLDFTIGVLERRGYSTFIALDEFEEEPFRQRFSRDSSLGRLDWPPLLEYPGPIRVRVYSVAERERHAAGERQLPRIVPPS